MRSELYKFTTFFIPAYHSIVIAERLNFEIRLISRFCLKLTTVIDSMTGVFDSMTVVFKSMTHYIESITGVFKSITH
jgi:hypothetical protein